MHSCFIQTAATDVLVGTYSTVHKHNFSAHDAKAHNTSSTENLSVAVKGHRICIITIY